MVDVETRYGEAWKEDGKQGVFKARNLFQLDTMGMMLAFITVALILFKQYYLKREENRTTRFIMEKLAKKDNSVKRVAVVCNSLDHIRNDTVLECLRGIPTAVATVLVVWVNNASSVQNASIPSQKTLDRFAKHRSIPTILVVRDVMEEERQNALKVISESADAVVGNFSSNVPQHNIDVIQQIAKLGKHFLCLGSMDVSVLQAARKIQTSSKSKIQTQLSSFKQHPLFNRVLARARVVGTIQSVTIHVSMPSWQSSASNLMDRVPFLRNIVPRAVYQGARVLGASNGTPHSLCHSAVEFTSQILKDLVLDTTFAEYNELLLARTEQLEKDISETGHGECRVVPASNDENQLAVRVSVRRGGWQTMSTRVVIEGSGGAIECMNLHYPCSGHKLVVRGVSELAYGSGKEVVAYALQSFISDL